MHSNSKNMESCAYDATVKKIIIMGNGLPYSWNVLYKDF